MKKTYLNSFCARCLTLLVLALLSTNLAWGKSNTVSFDNLGYSTWGESSSFSGSSKDQVSQTKNGVSFTYTRNSGSLYANTSAIRFYQTNELKFDAPEGYSLTSITWSGSNWKDDVTTDVETCSSTTSGLSWTGSAKSVTFTRPKNASSYLTLSSVTVIIEPGASDKTLTSIEVSGTHTKTEYYVGDEFDPTGLVVTGTYDEGDPEVITSGITWNVTPSPLTIETISVSVTATVGDITSPEYVVNGLTVTEKPALPSYKLVTDASTLTAGDRILIVGTKDDVYYALAPYESGNNCKRNEVSAPVDGIIDTEVAHITLGGATGAWTLFDGTYYLYAAGGTGSNNYLKGAANADNNNAKWTISIANDGKATIKTVDKDVKSHTIRHNTGNDLFSCYASGQADVYIYKYEAKTKEVTISDAGWATACLPFNATISDNATAYYVTTSGSTLNKVEANVIPANEGVLLKSNEGGAATVTFTESAVAADVVEANYMKGSVAGKTFNESGYKYYILANDETKGLGFYFKVEGGASVTCAAGKAVLAVPAEVAGAKEGFPFDEEPTGISELKINNHSTSVYNLNGLKVNEAYKGIVIMNGKKYINK